MNVAVIGLGKLGSVLGAVLADAGHTVIGVDKSDEVVNSINCGLPPVDEPHLGELMQRLPNGRFTATTDYAEAIPNCDMSMIVVPTPSGRDGRFSNEFVLEAVRDIGKNTDRGWHNIVVCSTVMPGSMDKEIIPALEAASGKANGRGIGVLYSPEFIALGSVIHDMLNPDTVFIGARDNGPAEKLRELIESYTVTSPSFHVMSYNEAELAKIAVNAYVTMKISYASMISEFCEKMPGASAVNVLNAVGSDSRIGTKYLKPGASFGGPCFPRDNRAMVALSWELKTRAELPYATDRINMHVSERVSADLSQYNSIAVLGLAYKPNTSVVEESMGLSIATTLAGIGKEVKVHDPLAAPSLPDGVKQYDSVEETIAGTQAVVVCTPHAAYRYVEFGGRILLDCWDITLPQSNRRVLGTHCWWW